MLSPGRVYPNTVLAITATFADEDGTAIDPDTVTFKTSGPCCSSTSYVYGSNAAVTRTSAGNYRAQIAPDSAGRWSYRWETTGTGATTISEGSFIVQSSPFVDRCCWDYA